MDRALRAARLAARSGKSLSQLLEGVQLFPQTLLNVRLEAGQDWKKNQVLSQEIEKVEKELGNAGRVLIRPSGTEPLLRVMVEARDEQQARKLAERLAGSVRAG